MAIADVHAPQAGECVEQIAVPGRHERTCPSHSRGGSPLRLMGAVGAHRMHIMLTVQLDQGMANMRASGCEYGLQPSRASAGRRSLLLHRAGRAASFRPRSRQNFCGTARRWHLREPPGVCRHADVPMAGANTAFCSGAARRKAHSRSGDHPIIALMESAGLTSLRRASRANRQVEGSGPHRRSGATTIGENRVARRARAA